MPAFPTDDFMIYDAADVTKHLNPFDLSRLSTGARYWIAWPNKGGTALVRVGAVDLEGQTANIGVTDLVDSVPEGVYEASVYHICTTAGTAGTLATTIRWLDDTGSQSVKPAADLSLATTGFSQGKSILRVHPGAGSATGPLLPMLLTMSMESSISTTVTYECTMTGVTGSPVYAVYIRLVAL